MTVSHIHTNFGVMRITLCILLYFILVFTAAADTSQLIDDSSNFQAMGLRADGTISEELAFEYIATRLKELGIEFERQSLDSLEQGQSFSENIIAEIPGTAPGVFAVASAVDHGAFSASVLMELARRLSITPPKHTMRLMFLGAERGPSELHPLGSRAAIQAMNLDEPLFALYLDSEDVPRNWRIRAGGNGIVAPYWLVKNTLDIFTTEFISFRLRGTDVQVARLGLQGDIGPLEPWLESGIATLLIEGNGKSPPGERSGNINRILNAILTLDRRIDSIPSVKEQNYMFFRPLAGLVPRGVPELTIVSAFLIAITILLGALLFRARDIHLNLSRFSIFWWTWPLVFIIVFLFSFLSTLIIEETTLIADFPDIWIHAPGIFIFFKLAMAASFSLIFLLMMRGLPLPRSPHYYSYAAVGTAMLALLVITSFDITLASYPLWTLINLVLFTATRNERRKALFLGASLFPYIIVLAVIISEPYRIIIESIIFSRIKGNITLTFLLLPLIFAFTSMGYWKHHFHRTRRSILTPVATITLTLSAGITLIWILSLSPYNEKNPQPVKITDLINLNSQDRRLELESPKPIGDVILNLEQFSYPLEKLGRKAEIHTALTRIPLTIEKSSRSFLGRRTMSVTIEGEEKPQSIALRLYSSSPFTLHEASQPFDMNPAGNSAKLYVGLNPTFPFNLRFTVNANAKLRLAAEVLWESPKEPPNIIRSDLRAETSRIVLLEVEFGESD